MTTKPYTSGGAYIHRMSDLCGGCRYRPADRAGDRACPYTVGYWSFLNGTAPGWRATRAWRRPCADWTGWATWRRSSGRTATRATGHPERAPGGSRRRTGLTAGPPTVEGQPGSTRARPRSPRIPAPEAGPQDPAGDAHGRPAARGRTGRGTRTPCSPGGHRHGAGEPRTPADAGPMFRDSPAARRLLSVRAIHAEPAAAASPRGRQILRVSPKPRSSRWTRTGGSRTSTATRGTSTAGSAIKSEVLVLGERKTLTTRPNGRSADWIAPGPANGCAMACAYCYVPRRKGYANPITVFTNIESIIAHLSRHVARLGPKTEANQCDPTAWVYDIGENSDCSVDALISDNVADLIRSFARCPPPRPLSPPSSSTRTCSAGPTRPHPGPVLRHATGGLQLLDIRTSPVERRIAAAGDFLEAGYEVHFNFSPVVSAPGLGTGLVPPATAYGRRPAPRASRSRRPRR